MPLSTRMPYPGVCVMPSATSPPDEPIWKTSGVGEDATTLPRLADVVNCTSAQGPGKAGGTLPGVGQASPAGAAGMLVAAKGLLEAIPVPRLTVYRRNRLPLTTAVGPRLGSM